MAINRFNVRVYGIWMPQGNTVLVADEIVWGRKITKFPGGGLEFGEGPADAIIREWKEELATDIRIIRQLYFTDFPVASFMNDGSQVLSLYFEVEPLHPLPIALREKPFDFPEEKERAEAFRLISLHDLSPDHLTFPIDKHVATLLIESFQSKATTK